MENLLTIDDETFNHWLRECDDIHLSSNGTQWIVTCSGIAVAELVSAITLEPNRRKGTVALT